MSTRAAILAELRELRKLAEMRLPRAERADVCRRIRNYQRELVEIRDERRLASPARRRVKRCLMCRGAIIGRPFIEDSTLGVWCSETCLELFDDERHRAPVRDADVYAHIRAQLAKIPRRSNNER